MKFFFSDGWDTVDPGYDFTADCTRADRDRQRADYHAHDFLSPPPYDGILVSRSTIGGFGNCKYAQGQRLRLKREGIRQFLRFGRMDCRGNPVNLPIMGDCGAFSYASAERPPYSAEEMLEFYLSCGFTHGVAPDHIISVSNGRWDDDRVRPNWVNARAEYTIESAKRFISLCRKQHAALVPVGVVQSWSAASAKRFAHELVGCGYDYIGVGGLWARGTRHVADLVAEVRSVIPPHVRLHIFGFCKPWTLGEFSGLGITSFDSSSPLFMACKDRAQNYFIPGGGSYMALRVPSSKSQAVARRVLCGALDDAAVRELEARSLRAIRDFAGGTGGLEEALASVRAYEQLVHGGGDHSAAYRRTLGHKPWLKCPCAICRELGVEVVIHRGMNRNNRRGFHNLFVFHESVKKATTMEALTVPCIRIEQNPAKPIFSFAIEGRDLCRIASISRLRREESGEIGGYQRPEIVDHVADIRQYVEREHAILPNSIVIAFSQPVEFTETGPSSEPVKVGRLKIPVRDGEKVGWIVDGQQRTAALRSAKRSSFPVSVVGFQSSGVEDEREQFVLVNSVKPLPKSMVYELLPGLGDTVPPRLRRRQRACGLIEELNTAQGSPFHRRIRTITARGFATANIKDTSVLKMIENSMNNGAVGALGGSRERCFRLLSNYWGAVAEHFGAAWALPPQKSRLTHGVGVIGMGYLMDTIAHGLSGRWDVPPLHAFLAEVRLLGQDLPWSGGTWEFDGGMRLPWNEIQNTTRHIELVANYIIRRYRRAEAGSAGSGARA